MTKLVISKFIVHNFRNLKCAADLNFSAKINCFYAPNGHGKTNFLESVFILSNRKSFRKKVGYPQILDHRSPQNKDRENSEIYFLSTITSNEKLLEHSLTGRINENLNEWYFNGKRSRLLNKDLPLRSVFIAPYDSHQFFSVGKIRRDWFDQKISKIYPKYYLSHTKYTQLIKHRNNLLKERSLRNLALIKAIDIENAQHIQIIAEMRKKFIDEVNTNFESICLDIFDDFIPLKLEIKAYINSCLSREEIYHQIQDNLKLDQLCGHTQKGPHLDDYTLYWGKMNANEFASTGQQKISYLGLLFAYTELFRYNFNSYPILLIDDMSSELDNLRWKKVVDYILNKDIQAFITTTNVEVWEQLGQTPCSKKFKIKHGEVSLVN